MNLLLNQYRLVTISIATLLTLTGRPTTNAQTVASSPNAEKQLCDEQGFNSIFDGKTFKGWKGSIDGYAIVDGAIRCKKNSGGTIYTDEEYSDFVVRLEFKLPPGGNNGLAIRYPGKGDAAYVGMCELQILDNDHQKFNGENKLDDRQYHGSAYGMVAAKRGFLKPTGQWNQQEVTVIDSKIKVVLNGTIILDCDLSQVNDFLHTADKHPGRVRTKGHFGLAGHHDPVEFRNLCIKKISR